MSMTKHTLAVAAALALLGLAGCGGDGQDDLRRYVQKVEARKGGRIEPIPKPKEYVTFRYQASALRDPFEPPAKEEVATARANQGLQPDLDRPRDVLEQFPLDSLRMMGTIAKDGELWALIKASDGTLYRARKGEHIGQDNGEIIAISETEVKIKEIVPDGLGGWTLRESVLKSSE